VIPASRFSSRLLLTPEIFFWFSCSALPVFCASWSQIEARIFVSHSAARVLIPGCRFAFRSCSYCAPLIFHCSLFPSVGSVLFFFLCLVSAPDSSSISTPKICLPDFPAVGFDSFPCLALLQILPRKFNSCASSSIFSCLCAAVYLTAQDLSFLLVTFRSRHRCSQLSRSGSCSSDLLLTLVDWILPCLCVAILFFYCMCMSRYYF
jgi:hypothetical protein